MLSAARMIAESHKLCRALNLCAVPDGPFPLGDSVSHLSAGQQWSHRDVVKNPDPDTIKVEDLSKQSQLTERGPGQCVAAFRCDGSVLPDEVV